MGFLLTAFSILGNAHACSPPPPDTFASTEKRVGERYAMAQSIELATIVDVQPVTQTDGKGNVLLKGERVTFRVDRAFKGKSRPGDKLVIESTNMCDYSVAGNAALKTNFSTDGGIILPPRQWLLYRLANARVSIGGDDLARPVTEAAFDLQLLQRWRKRSKK